MSLSSNRWEDGRGRFRERKRGAQSRLIERFVRRSGRTVELAIEWKEMKSTRTTFSLSVGIQDIRARWAGGGLGSVWTRGQDES